MSQPPSRWQFTLARLRYEKDRWRGKWRLATDRCPACPKNRGGSHKFGCRRPGAMPSMRQIRRDG